MATFCSVFTDDVEFSELLRSILKVSCARAEIWVRDCREFGAGYFYAAFGFESSRWRGTEGKAPQGERLTAALRLMWLSKANDAANINRPCLNIIERPPKVRIDNFDFFPDASYQVNFGHSRADVERVYEALDLPEKLMLQEGEGVNGRSQWGVSSVHAYLYMLWRMHSPAERVSLDTTSTFASSLQARQR